jgi:hypothetical protein
MSTEQKPQLNTDQKTQLAESLEKLKMHLQRWEKVRHIAQDIIGWTTRDARRFSIEVASSVGTKIVYGYIRGAERYIYYGEELNDTPLRQIYERFFEDHEALINMIKKLAEAVKEVSESEIERLKESA